MSAILHCQDPCFAGGPCLDGPFSNPPSAASVAVSKETMLSLWATGLLDNRASRRELQRQDSCYRLDFGAPEGHGWGEQMSSQMYANKQLQDTLVQKEEELARLHEENNKLKEYLSSAYVRSLEAKAKKFLSLSGKKMSDVCRMPKRKLKERDHTPCDAALKKARRNLFADSTACQEQTLPVNTWVLQTLGLKDVDTIDDAPPGGYSTLPSELVDTIDDAPPGSYSTLPSELVDTIDDTPPGSYSALSSGLVDSFESYRRSPVATMDYNNSQDSFIDFECAHTTPVHHSEETLSGGASPYLLPCGSAQGSSPASSGTYPPCDSAPCYASNVSPNKTELAFSTSLNPHRNVKTHTFAQGQAFVRRDDEGGWKFTWVPKQTE